MRFRFLDFGPTVREKLIKLTGLHAIYASENISQIVNRVNIIAFARCDERKMSCRGHAAGVRANKKAILTHEDKRLNSAFAFIIVCALARCIGSVGTKTHPATLAPAGSTRGGSGGDKWSEALREKLS